MLIVGLIHTPGKISNGGTTLLLKFIHLSAYMWYTYWISFSVPHSLSPFAPKTKRTKEVRETSSGTAFECVDTPRCTLDLSGLRCNWDTVPYRTFLLKHAAHYSSSSQEWNRQNRE